MSYSIRRPMALACLASIMWAPALAAGGSSSSTQTASDPDSAPPVTIARSQVHDIVSETSGQTFRVMVWLPDAEPPADGFPVVYVLDANGNFGMVTDIVNARSRRLDATGMSPAVIVGLGYPTEGPYNIKRRIFDLTPPSDHLAMPMRPNGVPWPPTGGADQFLQFMDTQVKPLIDTLAPIDHSRQTLVGHSFGGLFALHVLFTHPDSFSTYVAGSPSIWFNNRQILTEARDALPRLAQDKQRRRLFMAVGGLEETLTEAERTQKDAKTRRQWKENNRMIGNGQEMADLLKDCPTLTTRFSVFEGEDHASIMPQFLNRGLAFALTAAGWP